MKAFTLLETIVSVLLFFIVFLALLESETTSKYLLRLGQRANSFYQKSSIVFLQKPTAKNLYESLLEFNITQDRIIQQLKKENITYKEVLDSSEDVNLSDRINFQKVIVRLITYGKEFRAQIYSPKIVP